MYTCINVCCVYPLTPRVDPKGILPISGMAGGVRVEVKIIDFLLFKIFFTSLSCENKNPAVKKNLRNCNLFTDIEVGSCKVHAVSAASYC
jgi:hypothetical protein